MNRVSGGEQQFLSEKGLPCQAPTKSMRFSHSGNVIACCYNRGHILGSFPQQTLNEIWFGEPAQQLREAICQNDFSLGCATCERQILSGNRAASGAFQYDYLSSHPQNGNFPTMLDFEIDSTCNLECIMCSGEYSSSIRKNRERAPKYHSPYNDEFVKQLEAFIPHLSEARFVGGEPFLIPLHFKIWDLMVRLNPSMVVNVLTNATVLDDRIKKLIASANFKISLSIDSLVKDTYEQIRLNADFDTVMSNFRYFKAAMDEKGHVMNFNLCAMRQNWKEIPEYFKFCSENGIQVVLHRVEFPNHCSLWNLPKSELEKLYATYEKVELDGSYNLSELNRATFRSLLDQVRSWMEASERTAAIGRSEPLERLMEQLKKTLDEASESSNGLQDDFSFISEVIRDFSINEQLKIIRFLLQLPISLLISELRISTAERMKERFKIVAHND